MSNTADITNFEYQGFTQGSGKRTFYYYLLMISFPVHLLYKLVTAYYQTRIIAVSTGELKRECFENFTVFD